MSAERVDITPAGQEALISLSGGDMRRVLNLLQSSHMAYNASHAAATGIATITDKEVYLTAGAALPAVINALVNTLFNESYTAAYSFFLQTIDEFGYALTDIVTEVAKIIGRKDLPDGAMAFIMDKLSNIELRLSHGGSEKLQLGALVGAFVVLRQMMTV